MLRTLFTAGIMVFLLLTASLIWASDEHWSSLDGPFWVNGIDVAYGASGDGQDWHRYLIGTDGNIKKLFYWSEINPYWFESIPLASANKLISYRNAENGKYAFCAAIDDDIFGTANGGVSWDQLGFPQNFNRHFSAVEVNHDNPATHLYVGCEQSGTIASVFQTTDGGTNWSQMGDGLAGKHIYDLELAVGTDGWAMAGTDDGIWRYNLSSQYWERGNRDLTGIDVTCLEPIEHHDFMWAATGVIDSYRRLYYSEYWDDGENRSYIEPVLEFDKEVNDMSVILIDDMWQSVYIAAQDGLYLLDVEGAQETNLNVRQVIDFKNSATYPVNPFKHDYPIVSVDYYQESSSALTRQILVGTEHSVYIITETRNANHDIINITFTDITQGTFISNTTSITFPEYDPVYNELAALTNSPEGIIKKSDMTTWKLSGLSNLFI